MRGMSRNRADNSPRLTLISAPFKSSSRSAGMAANATTPGQRPKQRITIMNIGKSWPKMMVLPHTKRIKQIRQPDLLDVALGAAEDFARTVQDGADGIPDQKPD